MAIITVKYRVDQDGLNAMFKLEERLRANLGEREEELFSGWGTGGMRDLAFRTNHVGFTRERLKRFFNRERIRGVEFGIREETPNSTN